MATTSNTFTGNGSTKTYSFTFPYLATTDIKIQLTTAAGVDKDITAYTLPSATSITFTALGGSATDWQETTGAPKSGVTILIYRDTDSSTLSSTFYPGSAIRSSDLNDNFTQNLYVTQEAEVDVAEAKTDAASAKTTATTANTTANTANTTANTANTNATAAVSTANTASTNASTAVSTANTASTNATNAVTTANAASAAVSTVLPYTIKANAAAVQSLFGGSDSPTADDIFELTETDDLPVKILSAAWASGTTYKVNDQRTNDSGKLYLCTVAGTSAGSGGPTGTGSSITDNTVTWKYIAATNGIWTISSVPSPLPTFSTGITVKLKYASGDASASSWTWQSYHANNPETRYAATASPAFTGTPTAPTAGSSTNTTQIATTAFAQPRDADLTSLSSCQSGAAAALALLTSTEVAALDGFTGDKDDLIYAKDLKATGVTATEFDYLDGVTSAIQTQLDAKQASDADTAKTDVDQEWSKPQRGDIIDNGTHSSGATADFDLDAGNNFKIDIYAAVELGFSNLDASREGQTGTIWVDNAAITPTWGAEVQFEGGSSGTISITQNAKTVLAYYVIPGGTKVLVSAVLDVKDD